MIPLVDRMRKVGLRTVTMPIQSQQIITKDNVSIGVAAVAYYRRVEAPFSYKDVDEVVATCEQAGLARRVARLRPLGVVKG